MPSTKLVTLRSTSTPYPTTEALNKGSKLTHEEIDANFLYIMERLNTEGGSYGTATGTSPSYQLVTPIIDLADAEGKIFVFKTSSSPNAGAATLALVTPTGGIPSATALTAKPITKNGAALVAGALPADTVVCVVYTGTSFELLSDQGSYYTKGELDALEAEYALVTSGDISWDFKAHPVAVLNLAAPARFNALDNPIAGKFASVRIKQPIGGGVALTFNTTNFKGTSDFTMSTGANEVDWLLFRINSSNIAELVGYRNNVGA